MLEKLEAKIKFKNGEVEVIIPESKFVQASLFLLQEIEQVEKKIPAEVKNAVISLAWAGEVPGKSKRAEPVRIDLEPGLSPGRIKEYPLKLEERIGLVPTIQKFWKYKLLVGCESMNQTAQDIHPVVANLHTSLTTLARE